MLSRRQRHVWGFIIFTICFSMNCGATRLISFSTLLRPGRDLSEQRMLAVHDDQKTFGSGNIVLNSGGLIDLSHGGGLSAGNLTLLAGGTLNANASAHLNLGGTSSKTTCTTWITRRRTKSPSAVNGGLRSVTGLIGKRNHDAVSFETPTGTIGVRGTNFGALFCQSNCGSIPTSSGNTPQNGLYVDVSQGAVVVSNGAGQQVFQTGQFGYVANLNTPPVVIPPTQGIPATMPLSISKNAPAAQSSSAKSGSVDCMVR
jgi:hypothetical protein